MKLRKRVHLLSPRYDRWLLVGALVLFALPFLLVALTVGDDVEFREAASREIAGDPRLWILVVAVPALLLYFWTVSRHERLVVTATGLEYRSPFRGLLGFLHPLRPDWYVFWPDIESARLKKGPRIPKTRAHHRQLLIRTRHGETRKLVPYLWYRRPDRTGLTMRETINLRDERYLEAVQASPLYRAFDERGLLVDGPVAGQADEAAESPLAHLPGGRFDLVQHPGAVAVLVVLVGLGGYGIVDGFFVSPWRYVQMPPAAPFIGAAGVAGIVGFLATRAVPRLERWALVTLVAAAAAGAVHPALLRVNAATDPDGVSGYRYRQVEVGRFEPVDMPDLPELRFTRGMEFWEDLPRGGEREFHLARGSPAFWQLDLDEVRAAQRAFYRQRRAEQSDE